MIDALEFDAGRFFGTPPPLPPPFLFHTHRWILMTPLDRPSSPPPRMIQDLQCDPAMGVEVGGTVPNQTVPAQ